MQRQNDFLLRIEKSPVIAAVRSVADIEAALRTDVEVIFILGGDVVMIPKYVDRIKVGGRLAIVHLDLVAGLTSREASVNYLKAIANADGIITTRAALIPYARQLGLATVLRYFVLDSMASENIKRQNELPAHQRPDAIEILPGIIAPKVMSRICSESKVPVIAGGLIEEHEDVISALKSGCSAISTTHHNVWTM